MRDPFYRLFETPADQGAAVDDAPAEDVELDGGPPEEEAPEEETYTRSQLAELLGPRFAERYAGAHEGEEAIRQFGQSFEETLKHVNRLSHGEQLEQDDYEALGLEPPAPPEAEPTYSEPLYGAPWAPPETWDELVDLADRNPRAAAEFALNREDLPDETKAWFFANWASVDAAGAFAYNQAATTAAAQAYADEQVAAIRDQVNPLVHDRLVANGQLMLQQASATIPGFDENAATVSELLGERQARDPNYHAWFLHTTLKEQLAELRDLTGIAIFRNQPAADAAADEERAATEADKARVKTETTHTGGGRSAASSQQSEFKKKNVADFQKLKDQGVI